MKTLLSKLKQLLGQQKPNETTTEPTIIISQDTIIKIHNKAPVYYDREDVVYLDEIDSYGAMKYNVVKEVLLSENFGVSPMHVALNKIYFQTNLEKHAHNKRAAIKHLSFLSKKLQFDGSSYITELFDLMRKNLPNGEVFNLADYLINPIILVNALNDLGFLEVLNELNPNDPQFSYTDLVQRSKQIFETRSTLEELLTKVMTNDNIPALVSELLNEISNEVDYDKNDLPLFYTTVIYTAIENTASFVGSVVYFALAKYPEFLNKKSHAEIMALSNELLRVYSPNFITFRTALNDVQVRGVNLKKGDLIALFVGAANRDPNAFPSPMEIKFDREEKHLAFGRGRISCIGQFAAFRMALNIIDELSLDTNKLIAVDQEPNYVTQGVVRLSEINVTYGA
jgi:hypothetical protein